MKDDAIHYIAMNLARHRKTGKNWRSETIKAYPEAEEKINANENPSHSTHDDKHSKCRIIGCSLRRTTTNAAT